MRKAWALWWTCWALSRTLKTEHMQRAHWPAWPCLTALPWAMPCSSLVPPR